MRRIICFSCILTILITGIVTYAFAETKHKFDIKTYDKIAKKTIGSVVSGNIDVDKMLSDMKKLVDFGISGCEEYMGEPETPPEEVKIMKITSENAKRMSSLTLDEIKAQWHKGGVLKANGIDINKFNHFSVVMCYYDAVVHPAIAIICLKEYRKTENEELLDQLEYELAEVRQHLKYLE